MRLAKLTASSVRGIPRDWPELPIGTRGMIVYGANGVGKSSIVDALERAVSGKTTVFPVPRQGVNWETGGAHIHDGPPDIAVEVSEGSTTFTLEPHTELSSTSEPMRRCIETARDASFVLRRHMLLDFITAQPKDRYGQLEPFLNLGTYHDVENGIKDWVDRCETEQASVNARITEREQSLTGAFDIEEDTAITKHRLVASLNQVLEALGYSKIGEQEDLTPVRKQITTELGGEEHNVRLAALGSLKTQLNRLGTATDLREMLNGLIEAVQDYSDQVASRTEALLTDLLAKGKDAIEQAGLTTCPICEQEIDRDAVLTRLEARIAADERITAAATLVSQRRRALQEQAQARGRAIEQLAEEWRAHVPTALPATYTTVAGLFGELTAYLQDNSLSADKLREYVPRLASGVANHDEANRILDDRISEYGASERRGLLNRVRGMIDGLVSDWPLYDKEKESRKAVDRKKTILSKLHGHAVEARKEAVRNVLKDVEALTNQFYESVHPGENIATSSLDVRDIGQGSITLRTEFHGSMAHPLLYYSESHLDTLGLCYFLALRRQEATRAPEFKILVLDDVMHSVDSEHRIRIARLLKDEFSDHQLVITTHDINFYEVLRHTLGAGQYEYYRINNWTLTSGPVLGSPLTDFALIVNAEERDKLGAETLASAGGRFFEWLLREISESLQIAIPARFNRDHDIGSMWPSVASKLKKQKGYATIHEKNVVDLDSNAWVRNRCGAHHNPDAASPSEPEVREFARLLAALHDSLYCYDCARFVSKASNTLWRCGCEKIEYSAQASR